MAAPAIHSADGGVFFDEYHHGHDHGRGLVAYAQHTSLQGALIYGLLLLSLCVWRWSQSMGRPLPRVAESRRESSEYLRAMSLLYQKGGMHRLAMETLHHAFQRELMHHLRWRRGAFRTHDILAALERKHGRDDRMSVFFLRVAQLLEQPALTEAELAEYNRQLNALEQELIHGRA
jgi:hypothetical protein